MLAYRHKCQLQSQQKNTNTTSTSAKIWNKGQKQKSMYSKNIKKNRKLAEEPQCQHIKLHDTQNGYCYDYLISNKFKIIGITLKFILTTQDKLISV
jgi:hypothetical protein